ncbi:MAG TPA: CPBP family intramembrane metalloprotease [Clostridiaceae bacterium]|nr:CPBP family intramembrane metalloprotease [Clostridiaceae bacterium]
MKKLLKGLGAAIGYILVYIIVSILVAIAGSIAYGIIAGIAAFKTDSPLNSIFDGFRNNMSDSLAIFTIIAGLISLFIYWLIIIAGKKTIKERLDLIPVSLHKLWPIIPLGIFFNLFIANLLAVLPLPDRLIQDYAEASSDIQGITPAIVLSVVLMAPVLEEVLFRGLVFKSLHRGMPLIPALILQALVFGLLHGQIIWICYATLLGIALGITKARYVSLYPCILFHLAFNGWNYIMVPVYNLLPDSNLVNIAISVVSAVIIVLLGILIFRKTARVEHAYLAESAEDILSSEDTGLQSFVDYE